MSHTPGPWRLERNNPYRNIHGDQYLLIESACERLNPKGYGNMEHPDIARAFDTYQEGELEANGRLIAAAPTLLEAAKLVVRGDAGIETLKAAIEIAEAK